jgi:hypothetical protein
MESRELLSVASGVVAEHHRPRLRLGSVVAQGYAYFLGMNNKPQTPLYALNVTNNSNVAITLNMTVTYNTQQVKPATNIPNGTVIPAGGRFVVFSDSNNASFALTFATVRNPAINGGGTLFTSSGVTTSVAGGFVYPPQAGWAGDFRPTQSAPNQIVVQGQAPYQSLALVPVSPQLGRGHHPHPPGHRPHH